MDIRELLKYLRAEASDRAVQRGTGMHRKTVKRYRQWAKEQGLLQDSLPPLGELEQLLRRTLPELCPPWGHSVRLLLVHFGRPFSGTLSPGY